MSVLFENLIFETRRGKERKRTKKKSEKQQHQELVPVCIGLTIDH